MENIWNCDCTEDFLFIFLFFYFYLREAACQQRLTLKYPLKGKSCIYAAGDVQRFEEQAETTVVFEGLLATTPTAAAPFILFSVFMDCAALVVILPPLC